ncbi:MAG TPA: hypothetical protein V6C69_10310 [Trichormus sp.]|jgi:DNA-binding NarL/FixJ family response regulator
MNSLTKIFIAEQDCESLVNTMLWLEQYADFEVYGTAQTDSSLTDQIEEMQPDVVIFGVAGAAAQVTMAIKAIRSTSSSPAVMVVSRNDVNVDSLAAEADGQIGPRTGLKDVPELIQKAVNRRRLSAIATKAVPMAKAG